MLVIGPVDGFSEELASHLSAGFIGLEKRIFPDNEVCPRILLEKALKGEHAVLVNRMQRPTDPNRHLVESLLTVKNLKAMGAVKIDVVMPYLVYARQDKIFRKGEPLSTEYFLQLLKEAGASRIFAVSVHFHREEGIFKAPLPAFNVSGFVPIAEYLKKMHLKKPIIIGPDAKSGQSAKEIADIMKCSSAYLEKKRDYDTGRVETKTKLDVTGRDAVIIDDIASSGGTLINAMENLKNPNKIICAVVHPVLTGQCLEKVSKKAEFIACNTIDSPISKISVAPRIAEFIQG